MIAMEELLQRIEALKKSAVRKKIDGRMREFSALGKKPSAEQFEELCFCLLTANFNAERAIEIQGRIGGGFCSLPRGKLSKKLRELGYRYPNKRSEYICGARKFSGTIAEKIASFPDGRKAREWLVQNVRGLGYKEASHFLRNIGFTDVSIIDFHIIDLLHREGVCEKPKTLTPEKYLGIESVLERLAGKAGLNLAELDLYLWFLETGKVLK